MIISSWNVNSIRVRLNHLIEYLKKNKPNFLLLQEIKTENKNFPYSEIKKLGYESEVHGQKSYNGVAIIYNKKINNINFNIINDEQQQSRTISVDIDYKKLDLMAQKNVRYAKIKHIIDNIRKYVELVKHKDHRAW